MKRIWAVAAVCFFLLAALAIWLSAPGIQADIEARAQAALASARFEAVTATASGRAVTLTGYVEDDTQRAAAIAVVAALPGVAGVSDQMQSGAQAEKPDLYRFGAVWDGVTLSLTGFMPSRTGRDEIVLLARDALPRARLVDGLQVAPGAPDANWQSIAAAGLAAMKPLSSASLIMAGPQVTLKGVAPDTAAYAASAQILDSLPAPYISKFDVVVGAPAATPVAVAGYGFSAAWDGVSIVLAGSAPSAESRAELLAALKSALPGAKTDDRTAIDPSAPDAAWTDAAVLTLAQFGRLKSAVLRTDGRRLSLSGLAGTADDLAAVSKALNDMPAAYQARLEAGVEGQTAPPPLTIGGEGPAHACQMAFDEAFKSDSIAFDSGSSKLPESSATLIGRMAEIAATCPQARIEITGHTDSSGNAAGNLRLSDQRAGAVEAALIVKGVEASRLTAKGFGSARPIASNDTPDAKARNRRIEVIVRP